MMSSSERVDGLEGILRSLGFSKIRRQGGRKPGFIACCQFHKEANPSFSIGDNGLWICHGCGEKGNLRQLQTRLGGEVTDDWRFNLRMAGAQLKANSGTQNRMLKRVNLPEKFSEYALPGEVPHRIAKRLKWETIKSFHLGAVNTTRSEEDWRLMDRCILPIYFKEKCVGYHARALRDDMIPRYYNAPNFEIKDYLFNFDGCKKGSEIFVVEGAFNAMSMVEKGFPNTVATFGTQFRPSQLEKLFSLAPSSVTICFDRDRPKIKDGKDVGRAGQRATIKLGRLIEELLHVWVMPLPFDKDPNDLPAETLRVCYAKRFPFEKIARTQ